MSTSIYTRDFLTQLRAIYPDSIVKVGCQECLAHPGDECQAKSGYKMIIRERFHKMRVVSWHKSFGGEI